MTHPQSICFPEGKQKSSTTIAMTVLHRAGWVLADSQTVIQDGYVLVEAGNIAFIGQGRGPRHIQAIDHGPGVLMPSLVNVHIHLELSALKGKIDCCHGFRNWVRNLVHLRDALDPVVLCNAARDGVRMLMNSGNMIVGEISTLGLSRDIFIESGLLGVWFQEFLGAPSNENVFETSPGIIPDKAFSLAGHAPHTSSPQLLAGLKKETLKENLPFSIHVAESEDEVSFLANGKGPWAEFLTERGIDFSQWPIGNKTPVKYLHELGLLDGKTIAVHCITADTEDLDLLVRQQVHVCLCLRSNHTLHGVLPDVETIQQKGLNLCLGTDSLASVDTISISDEMAFIAGKFPGLSPNHIFQMATLNGAKALGLSNHFGSLTPGKRALMLYIPVRAANSDQLMHEIVNANFKGEIQVIGQDYQYSENIKN